MQDVPIRLKFKAMTKKASLCFGGCVTIALLVFFIDWMRHMQKPFLGSAGFLYPEAGARAAAIGNVLWYVMIVAMFFTAAYLHEMRVFRRKFYAVMANFFFCMARHFRRAALELEYILEQQHHRS